MVRPFTAYLKIHSKSTVVCNFQKQMMLCQRVFHGNNLKKQKHQPLGIFDELSELRAVDYRSLSEYYKTRELTGLKVILWNDLTMDIISNGAFKVSSCSQDQLMATSVKSQLAQHKLFMRFHDFSLRQGESRRVVMVNSHC